MTGNIANREDALRIAVDIGIEMIKAGHYKDLKISVFGEDMSALANRLWAMSQAAMADKNL